MNNDRAQEAMWRRQHFLNTEASYRISHELHDEDFGMLPGARSESVGAEHEPEPPASMLSALIVRAQKLAGWIMFVGICGAFVVAFFPRLQ